jgi:ubiquitin-like domain-containing CTD phosphatase 1
MLKSMFLLIIGKPPADDTLLLNLNLKNGAKIMMMGSSEQAIKDVSEVVNDTSVINDFEEEIAQQLSTEYREEYLNKVENRVKSYEVKILNEPREGKKLLVLDIDYTLFDHKSTAETGRELMRPYLHEFLATAYEVST